MKTIQNDTDHTGPVVTMAATQCQTIDLLQVCRSDFQGFYTFDSVVFKSYENII